MYVETVVDLFGYSLTISLFPCFGVVCLHYCNNTVNSHTVEFAV